MGELAEDHHSGHEGSHHRDISALLFDPMWWSGTEWDYSVERTHLREHGVRLIEPTDREARNSALPIADIVIASGIDHLTTEHVSQLSSCVGILCYSAGMDSVDVSAAEGRGIPVANLGHATDDVADHAVALLLAARRRIVPMHLATASGDWDINLHPELFSIRRLKGQTLGIVGAGAVGKAVATRARAFGMDTIATYRHPPTGLTPDLPHIPLEQLFVESDAIVLAASLTDSSRGMINRHVLSLAKPGTILVNVGRGALVVESDLAAALDQGTIGFAALDVRDPEPPDPASDRLTGRANVMQTPHIAGMSVEAWSDIHRLAAGSIVTMLRAGGRL